MKVAYISFAPFISGAERALQVMLRYAPQAGIQPIVVCPPGSRLPPWCADRGIPVFTLPLADRDKWHPFRWAGSVARVAALLRRQRVDVVHSNQVWSFSAAGAAAGLLGLPRVCHMRDEVSPEAMRWWCKSGVEAVICISRHIESITRPAWSGERSRPAIVTSLDPVELPPADTCGSAAAARADLRARLRIADNTLLLGFIGQIVPRKGLAELLRAAASLGAHARWHLVVAGRDPTEGQPYERECRALARSLQIESRVTFLGFMEDVRPFYQAIDVAVVPSLQEPLGLIPLEAGAHSKPSIVSATDGLVETIVDGVTGWLVAPGNVGALAARLDALLHAGSADIQAAGARARDFVVRHCDPAAYMRSLAELYAGIRRVPRDMARANSAAALEEKQEAAAASEDRSHAAGSTRGKGSL